MTVLSGLEECSLVLSVLTCNARRIRIKRENAVYDEIVLSHSSYKVEQHHLGLLGLQESCQPSFSTFMAAWKGNCKLRCANGDIGEVKQMNLKRIEQTLSRHNQLLGLLFHR